MSSPIIDSKWKNEHHQTQKPTSPIEPRSANARSPTLG